MDKYVISYDDDNDVLILKILEILSAEKLDELIPQFEELFEGKQRRYILVDMTESAQFDSKKMDKQMRNSYKELLKKMDAEKTAIYGTTPALRMVAKIALAVVGKSDDTYFCKTKEEALAWLKENTEK